MSMQKVTRKRSLVAGNRYDKFDKKNWLLVPKFSDVEPTVFLDVVDLTLVPNEVSEEFLSDSHKKLESE